VSTPGRKLIARIDELAVPPGMLAIWGLGQSGFILKGGRTVAYLDPYLTDSVDEAGYAPKGTFPRQFPPPLAPDEATNAQVVFCSHEHVDHTDPRTLKPLSQASPRAIIVGSSWSRDMLLEAGVAEGRIRVPKLDAPSAVSCLPFSAGPSAHYGPESDPERGHRWLGYVIELNGVTLYHSGDTILHDGLVDRLKGASVDIACLPVNGRDFWREHRGIIGNLDAREAAELAATIGADVLIPMHNDMFALNHASPAVLADFLDRHYPRQRYHWLQPGELYLYVKGPRRQGRRLVTNSSGSRRAAGRRGSASSARKPPPRESRGPARTPRPAPAASSARPSRRGSRSAGAGAARARGPRPGSPSSPALRPSPGRGRAPRSPPGR